MFRIDKNILYSLYWKENRNLVEIGRIYSVSGQTIMRTMIKFGIKRKLRNWKTNLIRTRNPLKKRGYIKIYLPSHPCCDCDGYVFEHRIVMEKHIGRHLYKSEIIHHIDGDRSNNHISNLMLLPNLAAHNKFHIHLEKRDFIQPEGGKKND